MPNEPEWVKQDRKNYGKNESSQISASALVPIRCRNFFNMQDASEIDSLRAAAPAFHHNINRALKVSGKVIEDPIVQRAQYYERVQKVDQKGFVTGAPVIDTKGRKLTIIHASAGHTKKTHTPVHRVANKEGESWLERETNLKLRV